MFQSTLLRKERHKASFGLLFLLRFNPRSYERSDSTIQDFLEEQSKFQSTLLRKERPGGSDRVWVITLVSIHAPTKGATLNNQINSLLSYCFNPRSYERSDCCICDQFFRYMVSIHAPTKGATYKTGGIRMATAVSIHAPTKGATLLGDGGYTDLPCFNPRSYERSDNVCCKWSRLSMCFNPRSYERSDFTFSRFLRSSSMFQSTLLRKERRVHAVPYARENQVSIHAPTKGATTFAG